MGIPTIVLLEAAPVLSLAQKVALAREIIAAKDEEKAKKEAEQKAMKDAEEAARKANEARADAARIAAQNAARIAAEQRVTTAKQNELVKRAAKKSPSPSAALNGFVARNPVNNSRIG